MAQTPDLVPTEEIAEREALRLARERRSPWIVASRIVARYRARLVPAIFALIILTPGLMMLLSRRDLSSEAQNQFDVIALSPVPTLIGRIGTLSILILSVAAIFGWFASARRGQLRRGSRSASRSRQRGSGERKGDDSAAIRARMLATSQAGRARSTSLRGSATRGAGRPARSGAGLRASRGVPLVVLLVAALIFHVSCAVLPQVTGIADKFALGSVYFAIVVLALYASRRMPRRKVLDAIQWSIAIFMLTGIALAFVNPASAVTSAGLDQRLSFIDSRFWGVGSNPNSVAPLAVLQLILQVRQRWQHSIIWLAANLVAAVGAVVVVIWAQSQTAWAAAAVILPWVFIRSRLDRRVAFTAIEPHHAVIGLIGLIIGVGILGMELITRNTAGAVADTIPGAAFWQGGVMTTATRVGDHFMTGRGIIWSLALDVWCDHPWLGFGSTAWDYDFRQAYGLPLATSAHNQWMQALSVSGLVGAAALSVYVVLLAYFAWRASGVSRGLTLALFVLLAVRMVTEVPLESRVLLSSDVAQHLALLYCLFVYVADTRQGRISRSARFSR